MPLGIHLQAAQLRKAGAALLCTNLRHGRTAMVIFHFSGATIFATPPRVWPKGPSRLRCTTDQCSEGYAGQSDSQDDPVDARIFLCSPFSSRSQSVLNPLNASTRWPGRRARGRRAFTSLDISFATVFGAPIIVPENGVQAHGRRPDHGGKRNSDRACPSAHLLLAASGIGESTVFSFAEAGARAVVVADLDEAKATTVAETSKGYATNPEYRHLAIKVDVRDEHSVQAMVAAAVQAFGRIDYCVNSAGIADNPVAPITELATEDYDRLNSVNNRGMMLTLREVSKVMVAQSPLVVKSRSGEKSLGRGSIVNVASSLAFVAIPGFTAYIVPKHAVIGLTKTAALDLAPSGVRVNSICPSWVDTPILRKSAEYNPQLLDIIQSTTQTGRAAMPEEVGDSIVFLCSPAGTYFDGASLILDSAMGLGLRKT